MSIPLPVPELWRENTSGLAKTGGRSTDSSNALMSKIAEYLMLHFILKTGCRSHFRFRTYGGKTLPGSPKLVEGALIAQKLLWVKVQSTTCFLWTENRMSVALPVPELWRENTSRSRKMAGKHFCVGKTGRSTDRLQAHEENITYERFSDSLLSLLNSCQVLDLQLQLRQLIDLAFSLPACVCVCLCVCPLSFSTLELKRLNWFQPNSAPFISQ
jgi:hypothetical protein